MGEIIESACSKEEYISIIRKILNDDITFRVENSNLSCSMDGKCSFKE